VNNINRAQLSKIGGPLPNGRSVLHPICGIPGQFSDPAEAFREERKGGRPLRRIGGGRARRPPYLSFDPQQISRRPATYRMAAMIGQDYFER